MKTRDERSFATLTPTLETSILANNDVFFVPTEIPNFFREAGGIATLDSVVVLDGDDQNVAFDLMFFSESVTLGTLNAAISITDANAEKCLGVVKMVVATHASDLINSILFTQGNIGLTMKAAAGSSSLWVGGVVRSGTPTYTASGMKMKFGVRPA